MLVTELAADGIHLVGHNKAYEQVLLPNKPGLLGRTVRVRITDCTKFSMKADWIEEFLLQSTYTKLISTTNIYAKDTYLGVLIVLLAMWFVFKLVQ